MRTPGFTAPTRTSSGTAFVVLGCHRSGTSAMTRTLALAGAGLPADLLPPHHVHNPAGYWESRAVVELNAAMLAAHGGSWDAPPMTMRDAATETWIDRAQDILIQQFGDARMIALKDPRLSLLVPMWREAIRRSSRDPVYVLMVRHPAEVAASLAQRNGLPAAQGLALWARYLLQADHDTRGASRLFVAYDDLLSDWRGVIARIDSLGCGFAGLSRDATKAIDEFLSSSLRRQRRETGLTATGPDADAVSALYEQLATGIETEFVLAALDIHRAASEGEAPWARADGGSTLSGPESPRRSSGSKDAEAPADRHSGPNWVLVTGAPRSGTSFLRALVHEHPNAALLQEYGLTALIGRVDAIVDRGAPHGEDWDRTDQNDDGRFAEAVAFYRDRPGREAVGRGGGDLKLEHFGTVALGLFNALAPGKTLRLVGDKMPMVGDWEDVPLLVERLPGLRILIVVRNPADVVRSSLVRREMTRRGRDAWPIETVQAAAAQWFAAWQRTLRLKARYGEAVRVVKYEDLRGSPVETMAGLYAFLGLPSHTPATPVASLPAALSLHAATEQDVLTNLLGPVIAAWPTMDIATLMQTFAALSAPYVLGDRIELDRDEALAYLAQGFSFREDWGRWTDGSRAVIEIRHGEPNGLLLVEIWVARAFARDSEPCDVVLRTGWGDPHLFSLGPDGARLAFLARAEESIQPGLLTIDVLIARPKRPDEPPSDARALGIGISAFRATRLAEEA